jgi:WD40 repeat protein
MMCEQAEDFLSAYLDDMLEPDLRADVSAHLDTCTECRTELADYRRLDHVLAAAPRRAPSDELHTRIFESPEYARLLRRLERADRGRAPLPLFVPRARKAPVAPAAQHAGSTTRHQSPPVWRSGAWRVAAVLALVIGSALLIKQGLLHSGTTTGQGAPRTIAGPDSSAPLAAGPRAVYLREGTLWSVLGSGAGLAQRLTPASVRVGGWAVSPDGQLVAYVDANSGRIHVIRSDHQSDQSIGNAGGLAMRANPAWSPDGTHIAYVARAAGGQSTLRLMNADGSNDVAVGSHAERTSTPVWSGDSLRLAYTQTSAGTQSVWSYSLDTKRSQQLAAQADGADVQAVVAELTWLPDPQQPGVTWSARDGAQTAGIFSATLTGSGAPVRLTTSSAGYTAAQYTPAHGGAWLAASASTLSVIPVTASDAATSIMTGSDARQVAVSPDGSTAAYVTADDALFIWSPGNAPYQALSQVTGAPVWSPDSAHLAIQANGSVLKVAIDQGAPNRVVQLALSTGATQLQWSPDGREVAIADSTGVTLASADGAFARLVDAHAAESPIAWTIAG